MTKQKTKKSLLKRVKITANKRMFRRHQLAAGHLKRNKTKTALDRQGKMIEFYKGESKTLRKGLGI